MFSRTPKKEKPLFSVPWSKSAQTTRVVRQAFLMSEEILGIPTKANWLVKWGGGYSITYSDGTMVNTDYSTLYLLTYKEWVLLANKLNPIT